MLFSRRTIVLAGMALPLARPALAHHGWSGYEADKPITITGTISRMAYEFPHAEIEVTDQTTRKLWRLVLAPPSRMQSRGLPADAIQVGMTCTCYGYPHRRETDEARIEYMIVDGKRVELR